MTLLLLNNTIKISLIVFAALAATTILRRRSAAVRHFVLAAALACAAATPAVRLVAPAWQASTAWLTTSRVQLIDRPLAVLDDSAALSTPSNAAHVPRGGALTAASALRALGVIWMTGAALAMFVLVAGLGRLSWLASHAQRIGDGPWADAAADIAHAYGLRRAPVVLHGDRASMLGTWGVLRSKVLVPADALAWPADRIRIVLAHELAHVRRRDWIVQMAAEILCAAYWFNPLVWLASRRLRLESEQACDDAVLTLGVDGAAYASELVDLARASASSRFVPAAAIARPSSLERRVRAMLNVKLNRDPITRAASIAAALVLAVATVLVAGFGVSAQTPFGSVTGSIADQNGRPMPGVKLVLSNPVAQTKHEVKSDAGGRYEIVGVPPGAYELVFEQPGFQRVRREGLSVSGQAVAVDAVMRIGSVSETIMVASDDTAAPAAVATTRPGDPRPDSCAASSAGGCITPPVKVRHVRPIFPAGAATGGLVILEGHIDVRGFMTDVKVLRNPDPALSAAAVEAVSGWEFLPTHLDGQPIETLITVTVNFVSAK